jgi:hypothetical protein
MPINPDKPALTQSDYDRFDFAYAKDLKDNYIGKGSVGISKLLLWRGFQRWRYEP